MSNDRLPVAQAARLFDLLSDESRLRVLLLLDRRGELTVNALCNALGTTQSALSHHLRLLRLGGLVESHRQRSGSSYSLRSDLPGLARELLRYVEDKE
jgi:DNA-binding transcriptional ArsR family regulator